MAESSKPVPQAVGQLEEMHFSIPWGHYRYLMDRYSHEPAKALCYVRKTIEEGWSRDTLLNFMDNGLYEHEGKALTNFTRTLTDATSNLAQELTKDPYNFAFTRITQPYNGHILKDALLANISQFLLELGTGFAYIGKEYRLQIGKKEKFIDLLFYNLNLSCYVVIEVKIGLLICRQKDSLLAQYALEVEGSNLPLAYLNMNYQNFTRKNRLIFLIQTGFYTNKPHRKRP